MDGAGDSTVLFLIRHGHTVNGEERRYKGHIDVELSQRGVRQMERLAEALRGVGLKEVYCSDLKRARRSAEIIAGAAGRRPVVLPSLRERSFGRWEGISFEEISRAYPEEFRRWKEDPLSFSPPGGESTLEVRDRVLEAFQSIAERHRGDEVAVVSHGGVNRVVLCHLMGISLQNIFRIEQDYGCLNVVELTADGFPVVKLLNWSGEGVPSTGG